MSGIATAIVGSAIIGSAASSKAAGKAANAQVTSAREANETQLKMFEQNREDMEPWRQAGVGALDQLTSGLQPGGDFNEDFTLGDFAADPGYNFRRSEGMRGIESQAAARGLLGSGSTLRDLTDFNSGLASQEYQSAYSRFNADRDRRFNRLSGVAGTGQTATTQIGQQGMATAGMIGNNLISAGNARGAAAIAKGNSISGAADTLGNFALGQYYMNRLQPTPAPPPAPYGGGNSVTTPFGGFSLD